MRPDTSWENDPVRAFSLALSPNARACLRLDFETIPVIRAAVEQSSAQALAGAVAREIWRYPPQNRWPLMWHRIRRAAGVDDTQTEIDGEQETEARQS